MPPEPSTLALSSIRTPGRPQRTTTPAGSSCRRGRRGRGLCALERENFFDAAAAGLTHLVDRPVINRRARQISLEGRVRGGPPRRSRAPSGFASVVVRPKRTPICVRRTRENVIRVRSRLVPRRTDATPNACASPPPPPSPALARSSPPRHASCVPRRCVGPPSFRRRAPQDVGTNPALPTPVSAPNLVSTANLQRSTAQGQTRLL